MSSQEKILNKQWSSVGQFFWNQQARLKTREKVSLGDGEIIIGKNTLIEPDVKIYPDCVIGENCVLATSCIIKEDCNIGNNCIIGTLDVLESGVKIGNNVTLQPFCVIARDTVLEDNVFIGPHFSCANDRHISNGEHGTSPNKKPYKAEKIIMKRGSRLGSSVTVAPGVIIGENAFVKMRSFIKSDVPKDKVIPANSEWDEGWLDAPKG